MLIGVECINKDRLGVEEEILRLQFVDGLEMIEELVQCDGVDVWINIFKFDFPSIPDGGGDIHSEFVFGNWSWFAQHGIRTSQIQESILHMLQFHIINKLH